MNWPWKKRKPEPVLEPPPAQDPPPAAVLAPSPIYPRKLVLGPTHVRVLVCPLERFVGPWLDRAGFDRVYYEPGTVLERTQALRPDVVMLNVNRGEEAHAEYLETVRKLRELEGCAELPILVFRSISPRDNRIEEAPGVARITIPFNPDAVSRMLEQILDAGWPLQLDFAGTPLPRSDK